MAKRAFEKMKKSMVNITVASMLVGTVAPLIQSVDVFAVENKQSQSTKRSVLYYGDWSIWGGQENFYPKDIPADQITHLNFAFLDFDSNGNLIFCDKDASVSSPVGQEGVQWGASNAGILPAFQELRAENPNLKIGVSLGGWSKSGDFSEVTADSTKRKKFVDNILKFIKYTNMDFVDVDWEYPCSVRQPDLVDNKRDEGTPNSRPEDKENYIKLLQDLRDALDKQGVEMDRQYELSVAIPAPKVRLEEGIDVESLFNIVDFANIMTYDMNGAWSETSGHQTGLYTNPNDPNKGECLSIDESVNYLKSKGADPSKLVIGAAYYSRGWEKVSEGTDSKNPGLFGQASIVGQDADQTPSYGAENEAALISGDGGRRGGVWSYRSLDKLKTKYPGLKEYWDDSAKAPYLYDSSKGTLITYDNPRSIGEKTKYVNDNNLGGMIGWMSGQDKPTNSSKRDELTKTSKQGLFGDSKLPEYEISYDKLDVTATVKPYKQSWGTAGGYEITVKNNERANESDDVLKSVETQAESLKLPKLYVKTDGLSLRGDYTAGTVTNENGYTVVDLKSVWEAKEIKQGGSYTFKLVANTAPTDISGIKSIEVAQRLKENGPDLSRQTIFGETDGTIPQNTAPVLSGILDKAITVGDAFDPKSGVTANDKEDGDLTNKIQVSGTVDTNKAATYKLTYTVSDSKGLKATKERTITVKEKETPQNTAPVLSGILDKAITVGDAFNPKSGVTATDKEDGDLTSKIQISGIVDTNKAGTYKLTYTVSDSKGLKATKDRNITVKAKTESDVNFGVGEGIKWPAQVNAPFTDMVAWITNPKYSNDGCVNLVKVSQETGVKFFNLAFVQAVSSSIVDGKVEWGWGGYSVLNEDHNTDSQYLGIKKSIKELREIGGDVSISFGGVTGTALWEATQDVDVLTNTYMELVKGYGLTNINLDIEGGAQDKTKNIANAKAIKKVQDETGVDVVLTVPVMPSGLTQMQIEVINAYLSQGVNVDVVNLMTMCYGQGVIQQGEDYGDASLRAVDNAKNQLKTCYKNTAGITLTDAEAYAKLGTTPSIGFESSAFPVFTTNMAQKVVNHATKKKLAMTSFWSMNRDAMLDRNSGIPSQYAFTNIFKNFGTGDGEIIIPENSAPVLSGITNKTINLGESFNVLTGVTATDKEDGDLTKSIKVSGTVDVNKEGTYTLTYTVQDKEGLKATKDRVITVKKEVQGEFQAWSRQYAQTKGYKPGAKVTNKGKIWEQVSGSTSWWAEPGTSGATEWKAIGDDPNYVEPDAEAWSQSYQSSNGYGAGVKVTHNGHLYLQTGGYSGQDTCWWGEPGTSAGNQFWKVIE